MALVLTLLVPLPCQSLSCSLLVTDQTGPLTGPSKNHGCLAFRTDTAQNNIQKATCVDLRSAVRGQEKPHVAIGCEDEVLFLLGFPL